LNQVEKLIVNNSNTINKTNNHISLQIIEAQNKPRHLPEIHILAWERHKYVAGLDQLLGYNPPLVTTLAAMQI
jgi:hypothetical protein